MTRLERLRANAEAALARAREIEARASGSEEPMSDDDRSAHDAAMTEFGSAMDEISAIEARQAAAAEAESRLADFQSRVSTPAGRRGRSAALDSADGMLPRGPHNDPRNTRGVHAYDFRAAIPAILSGDPDRLEGLERETHDALASIRQCETRGVMVPLDVPLSPRLRMDPIAGPLFRAAMTTTDGAGAIQTTVVPTLIDFLRASLVTQRLGATTIPASGPFQLPKQTGAASVFWVGEGADVTESKPGVGSVGFTPKTAGALTSLTRRLRITSSLEMEAFIQRDLIASTAIAIDVAAINGSGSSGQPKGILQYGGAMGSLAIGTNGGPLTWTLANQMIAKVNNANAPSDGRAWLLNELTASKLRTTGKETGYPVYVLDDAGNVAGFPVVTSTLVPSNLTKGTGSNLSAAVYGNWSSLVIAFFSGIDVVWESATLLASGGERAAALIDADINVRYPEAFCTCADIVTT